MAAEHDTVKAAGEETSRPRLGRKELSLELQAIGYSLALLYEIPDRSTKTGSPSA